MATFSGKDARVTVSADTTEVLVAEIADWKISMSASENDTTVFGDSWGKSDVGMKKWSGSLTGFFDSTDTTGQGILTAAFLSGDLLSDIRFYIYYSETSAETIRWYGPDTDTDSNAGVRITGLEIGQSKDGIAPISMTFSGSGPVSEQTEVVS